MDRCANTEELDAYHDELEKAEKSLELELELEQQEAKVTSISYSEYKKLESIIRTDFPNSKTEQFADILDMAFQLDDYEQAVIDFCNDNDITEEDLNDNS